MPNARSSWLVTGGAGFIGSHIATRIVELGRPVRVVDNLSTGSRANLGHLAGRIDFIEGDLRDDRVCARAVGGVEVVFHVAALPSVPRSLADPWGSHDANVNATLRLLEAARAAGVRRVVVSSSSSVYGDTPTLPKVEDVEPRPRSPYATSKLAAEQYVLAYARAGMLEGVALRYFNVFGPRQSPTSPYAAVVPLFFRAAVEGSPAFVFGDGGQTRDFTYVSNVVDANLLAADAAADRASGYPVNVGAGERTSINDLLSLIEEVTGRPIRREHRPPRGGDVRDSLAGLARAEERIDYCPRVKLPDGLRLTWEWFRQGT
jgi:UDP-glucose 4-epimerase